MRYTVTCHVILETFITPFWSLSEKCELKERVKLIINRVYLMVVLSIYIYGLINMG